MIYFNRMKLLNSFGYNKLFDDWLESKKNRPESEVEQEAKEFFERIRWGDLPICTKCRALKKKPSKREAVFGVYRCLACRREFSVTMGTICEHSHLPLHKWIAAICYLSDDFPPSIRDLAELLDISYRGAWLLKAKIKQRQQQTSRRVGRNRHLLRSFLVL
jgi:transposase-like protein